MLMLSWQHDTDKLIVHCPVSEWWKPPATTWKTDFYHQGNFFIHSPYRFIRASEVHWSQGVPQSSRDHLDCSTMTNTKLLSLSFLLPLQSCRFVWRSLSSTAQQGNNTAQQPFDAVVCTMSSDMSSLLFASSWQEFCVCKLACKSGIIYYVSLQWEWKEKNHCLTSAIHFPMNRAGIKWFIEGMLRT